ncbi:MAG: lipoyl(octanoyl) transferase LipB [Acidobacteriota bacterium]
MGSQRIVEVWSLGVVDYAAGLVMQEQLVARRRQGVIPDTLLFLEHPPVITLGRGAKPRHVIAPQAVLERRDIAVYETGRGGDVTYHGWGQLVGYPMLDLNPDRRDIRRYMRDLEEVLIRTVAEYGIAAGRVAGLTGVWVAGARKIAALGVRISRWITSHGFALNVTTCLEDFDLIVPCGIADKAVTSIARETGQSPGLDEVAGQVIRHFGTVFERAVIWRQVEQASVQVWLFRQQRAQKQRAQREYLVLRRTAARGGFWQPVTGRVEPGETPAAAARREVWEETGQEAEPASLGLVETSLLGESWFAPAAAGPIFNREYAFAVQVGGDAVRIQPNEHEAYAWLPFEAALTCLHWPGHRRALRYLDRHSLPTG